MKILIADDQLIYRRLARAALEPAGHEIGEVDNGLAAWERLEGAERPPLAMVDWMMPGLTGPEVCRKVRDRADASPPYLILVTGQGRPEDIVAGLEAGADDYITKPFNPAELRARVQVGVRILELRTALSARGIALEEALAQVRRSRDFFRRAPGARRSGTRRITGSRSSSTSPGIPRPSSLTRSARNAATPSSGQRSRQCGESRSPR